MRIRIHIYTIEIFLLQKLGILLTKVDHAENFTHENELLGHDNHLCQFCLRSEITIAHSAHSGERKIKRIEDGLETKGVGHRRIHYTIE
jgi:hypothetical protein